MNNPAGVGSGTLWPPLLGTVKFFWFFVETEITSTTVSISWQRKRSDREVRTYYIDFLGTYFISNIKSKQRNDQIKNVLFLYAIHSVCEKLLHNLKHGFLIFLARILTRPHKRLLTSYHTRACIWQHANQPTRSKKRSGQKVTLRVYRQKLIINYTRPFSIQEHRLRD